MTGRPCTAYGETRVSVPEERGTLLPRSWLFPLLDWFLQGLNHGRAIRLFFGHAVNSVFYLLSQLTSHCLSANI